MTQRENTFGTVRALDFQGVIFDGDHRNRFIFGKTSFLPVKPNRQAGTVLPCILFLRLRPRQRIKNLKFLFLTRQPTRRFQRGTDFFRHRLNFIPCRRDQQHGLVLLQCFYIRPRGFTVQLIA